MSFAYSLSNLREAIYELIARKDYQIAAKDEEIAKVYRYESPWEIITTNGTDACGSFKILSGTTEPSTHEEITAKSGYFRLKAGVRANSYANALPIPDIMVAENQRYRCGVAIDMSQAEYVDPIYTCSSKASYYKLNNNTSDYRAFFQSLCIKRLLLPEKFNYRAYTLWSPENLFYLHLSKTADGNNSNWIYGQYSTAAYVTCPKDANVPYYLNKFAALTAEYMVRIFENMIDRSAETTTKYITLGSANLAKLTEAQKNIAYAKGWDLA